MKGPLNPKGWVGAGGQLEGGWDGQAGVQATGKPGLRFTDTTSNSG